MHHTLRWRRAAGLLVTGLFGGAIALGGAAAVGRLGEKTTIVREELPQPPAVPAAFEQSSKPSINEVYRASAAGVVHVETQFGLGSGFVLDKAGHVVTSHRIVRGASPIRVSFSSNERINATVVGLDPSTDLAVLALDVASRALRPLPLGSSDDVHVGDQVIAVGNPVGLGRFVTSGIVSAVQRGALQTDTALNRGGSGGPLLNTQGEVIGVSARREHGFAVATPINTVKDVAAELIRTGRVQRAFLGLEGKTLEPRVARLFHLPVSHGVLVASVRPGSSAQKAGLKGASSELTVEGESWPAGGDVILRAGGRRLTSIEELIDAIGSRKPGDEISLEVLRGMKHVDVTVTLGRQP